MFAAQGRGKDGIVPNSTTFLPALAVSLLTDKPLASEAVTTTFHQDGALNLAAATPVRNPSYGDVVPRTDRLGLLRSQPLYYFRTDELTDKPSVLQDISPILSLGLPDAVSQSAVMRLLINEFGEVDEVIIEGGELSLAIQQLVRESFSKIRFKPGRINNMPVKSQLMIEVDLKSTTSPEISSSDN